MDQLWWNWSFSKNLVWNWNSFFQSLLQESGNTLGTPVDWGLSTRVACVFRLLSTKLQPPGGTTVTAPSGLRSRVCGQSLRPSLAPNHFWWPTTYLLLRVVSLLVNRKYRRKSWERVVVKPVVKIGRRKDSADSKKKNSPLQKFPEFFSEELSENFKTRVSVAKHVKMF